MISLLLQEPGIAMPSLTESTKGITVLPIREYMETRRLGAVSESAQLLQQHFTWCRLPFDEQQNREYIQQAKTLLQEKRGLILAVFHRKNGIYLGEVGIDWIAFDNSNVNIFYWIRKTQQNKGYATAAVQLLLKVLERFLPVEYAEIKMTADNPSSRRVAEKAGGKPADTHCFHYHFNKNREAEN